MSDVTFRDFAGAIMGNDVDRAAAVLTELLALDADAALDATKFFHSRTSDPSFVMKAMGLRNAVMDGTDQEIAGLLGECFGLVSGTLSSATAALRKRYPST